MDWLRENWFWLVVFVLFIGMHMFGHGHGGHGGHGGHSGHKGGSGGDSDDDGPDGDGVSRGGHHAQH